MIDIETGRRRRTASVAALAATMASAALTALAACGKASPQKRQLPATPVRVATATRIDAPVNILASGIVEPVQSVAVTAQVSGTLLSVDFKEGDFVQRGQVLFHIDPRPLQAAVDQSRATLARDQAQAEAARRDDERYRKLADMGYVSRSQSDQMHAAAQAAAATVMADQASLRSALVNLGFATIRAPIGGRTGSLLVRQGNNVGPGGNPLVVINQISPMRVRFPVLSQDFPMLQRAVAVRSLPVKAVGSDSSMTSEQGTLSFLDNAIDSLTGTVTGKAMFPNTSHRLWPGELVFLTVQVDVQHGVIAVPTTAIQTGQQGPYLYVVDAKNTAQTRPIATGLVVGDYTVVPRGLNAGERVVTDGQSRLNPGSRVAIESTGADTGTARLGANGNQPGGGAAAGDVINARAGAAGTSGVVAGQTPAGGTGAPGTTSAGAGRAGNALGTEAGAANGGARAGAATAPSAAGSSTTGAGTNAAGTTGATGVNGTTATPGATPTATTGVPTTTTAPATTTAPTSRPPTTTGTPTSPTSPTTGRPPTTGTTGRP